MRRPLPLVGLALQSGYEWLVKTPYVYRYMEPQFVDDFFSLGKLRISSFARFHRHEDEQRGDREEGWSTVIGEHGDSTFMSITQRGHDAYVLCGTTVPNREAMRDFGTGCIWIVDTARFAIAVSLALPFYGGGIEGHCIYQDDRSFRVKLDANPGLVEHQAQPAGIDLSLMIQNLNQFSGPEMFFLKSDRFSHQSEYRFVWYSRGNVPEYLDIQCPDAVKFCRRV
ncbi:MAG: hypothetical protein HOQ09_09930 [Gemmatimonadaceae bacterium]|nr:hypothetical protein [Gemmatimonadaceae bacterium]